MSDARMSDCPSPLGTVCKDPACPVHFPANQPAAGADEPAAAGADEPAPPRRGTVWMDTDDPRAPKQKRHNWVPVRKMYVEGVTDKDGIVQWPTLQECAEKFDIEPSRVRERSAMEGWVGERARWQQQMETVRRNARAARLSKEATNLDGRALDAAKMGLQLCMSRLAEIGQQAQQRRTETVAGGSPTGGIDAQEQQRLAQAVDLWHKVGLRAIGDPETHRVEITGAGGQPIEITTELRRDDPNRITGVLAVLAKAGLGDLFAAGDVVAGGTVEGDGGTDGVPASLEARR